MPNVCRRPRAGCKQAGMRALYVLYCTFTEIIEPAHLQRACQACWHPLMIIIILLLLSFSAHLRTEHGKRESRRYLISSTKHAVVLLY